MAAQGCNGRGGNANGKKYEAANHRGQSLRAHHAAAIARHHERAERRAGKAAILESMEDVYAADFAAEVAFESACNR